jgi:hypothetical protein
MGRITFGLDYFNHIAEKVRTGQPSILFKINSDSPDHLKTTITMSFLDELNPGVQFPDWMGSEPRCSAPWTKAEESELLRGFKEEKLTIEELCKKHGRGRGGIVSRLSKYIPGIEDLLERQLKIYKIEKELLDLKRQMGSLEQQLKDLE